MIRLVGLYKNQVTMAKKMGLLERIAEITANSVTPEEFKETWGYTIDEHVEDMMDRIHQLEGKKSPATKAIRAGRRLQAAAVAPAAQPAAAAKSAKKSLRTVGMADSETLGRLAKKVSELLAHLEVKSGAGIVVAQDGLKSAKQRAAETWALKLVAVETGSGKSYVTGAPVVITSLDNPGEERIVAKVYSPKKKGRAGLTDKTGLMELKGLDVAALDGGVKGLMVDVGNLIEVMPGGTAGVKGRKGMKGPK